MAMFQVTSAKLKSTAGELRGMNGKFKNKKQELSDKEQALCQMWEGEAKNAFHAAFLRDGQQMDAFYQLIEQYVEALLEIAKKYEIAEARNVQLASGRSY